MPGCRELADVGAVGVKHLDAGVVAIGDIKEPLCIENERVRQIELARPVPGAAPGFDEDAVLVELHHTRLALAVALQHEDVAGRPDNRLVRFVEQPQMAAGMPFAGPASDAQHHFKPSGRIELVDDVGRNVGRPDVVLRVDPQTVRPVEQPVAEPADEIAVAIEFHQRHRPAMDDEDVAFGVERNARRAAKVRTGRQLEGFGNRDIGKR